MSATFGQEMIEDIFPSVDSFISPEVAFKLCIDKFNSLPRTGKPNSNEWTVLSCIIEYNSLSKKARVVSLGTGTKCIGYDQMCRKGLILNDSHAEVMARRGFLRYLYSNMTNSSDSIILNYCGEREKFRIENHISFHFFSTHAPCGDATIVSTIADKDSSDAPLEKRRKLSDECKENFTGAKLITSGNTDLMSQEEGALRTKPGRGVRTRSMSCSDKLSRWNVLGIQGALIDMLLDEPVYLKTFTFSGKVNKESTKRAIYGRWSEKALGNERYQMKIPEIRICTTDLKFAYAQNSEKEPAPASVAWCDVREKPLEVAVAGKRQGVTKSKRDTLTGALRISKQWLLHDFHAVLSVHPSLLTGFQLSEDEMADLTYNQHKALSTKYQSAWKSVEEHLFLGWSKNIEDYSEFRLNSMQ